MFQAILKMESGKYGTEVYYGDECIKTYNYPIGQSDIETILRTEMLYRGLDRGEMIITLQFAEKHDSRVFVMDFDEKLFTSYSIDEFEQLKKEV